MDRFAESLHEASQSINGLTVALADALVRQDIADSERRAEAARARRHFWATLTGLAILIVVVLVGVGSLLAGQQKWADESEARSVLSRDRQQCATALLVNFNTRLGAALTISQRIPRPAPDSPEYRAAIDDLDAASALIARSPELCYGEHPNPRPTG